MSGPKSALGTRVACPGCAHSFYWTDCRHAGESFVVYDLETTGLDPNAGHRVVEIAREPRWYAEAGVADTIDGRFDMIAAVLALVGFVNIPIIKFSVDWWNTLHQPASITRLDAPAIDPAMLTPLLVMALAFTAYFITMLLVRMRADLNAARARALRLSAAE